jgi:hypothetical protein
MGQPWTTFEPSQGLTALAYLRYSSINYHRNLPALVPSVHCRLQPRCCELSSQLHCLHRLHPSLLSQLFSVAQVQQPRARSTVTSLTATIGTTFEPSVLTAKHSLRRHLHKSIKTPSEVKRNTSLSTQLQHVTVVTAYVIATLSAMPSPALR